MALTDQEKIDKFIECAKLSGFNPLVVGPDHVNEYANKLAKKYGRDRWDYFATVTAIGSVYTMMVLEFEEEGREELIPLYKQAIQEWDEDALQKVEELKDYVTASNIVSKEEYYRCIGSWLIEQMKESEIEISEIKVATDLGRFIRTNMDIAMLH